MAELFDADGNTVEAYTPDEVDEMIVKEKEEAVAKANELREEEIKTLNDEKSKIEAEKAELEKKVTGYANKDVNLGNLRKNIESKDKKIEELEGKIVSVTEDLDKKLSEMSNKMVEDTKNKIIADYAGDDKELADKINFHYGNFKGTPSTTEDMKKMIDNAYILATGGKSRISLTGNAVSGAYGSGYVRQDQLQDSKLSDPSLVEVAKKLGITEQDIKKHKLI